MVPADGPELERMVENLVVNAIGTRPRAPASGSASPPRTAAR
ncbi:MAG: hypothetical protein WB297_16470 [Actinomycetota bacterium]